MAISSILGALLPSLIGAGASAASSVFGRKKKEETPIQSKQRELIDDILASVKGQGPFSDMFKVNEEMFQKSYVEPAKARFSQQIAPQIAQSFVGGQYGQQRLTGTPFEDSLARAGVDLDQMLNQQYAQLQGQAQQRQYGALERILGQGPGAMPSQSAGSAALQGLGGYLASSAVPQGLESILSAFSMRPREDRTESLMDTFVAPRKGFEREQQVYNPYTGVQQ